MHIALAQFNPTVGAIAANVTAMQQWAERALSKGAQLVLFPELAVCGYPPRDLLDREEFRRAVADANERLCQSLPPSLFVVFGTIGPAVGAVRGIHNEAWVVQGGRVLARAQKQLLPTYDVFDELRYFQPGGGTCVVDLAGVRTAITICEDAWFEDESVRGRYPSDPLGALGGASIDLTLNLSASPFTLRKWHDRAGLFASVAERLSSWVVMANQVGGNDELIFDGASGVWTPGGNLFRQLPSFEEALEVVELPLHRGAAGGTDALGSDSRAEVRDAATLPPDAALFDALVLGVRDYVRKCGFRKAVLGLSGGIDSALTAAIAARALGPENVIGLAMPMRYSSPGSVTDAADLAHNLGVTYREVPLDSVFQSYIENLAPMLDGLGPAGPGDVTLENLQARVRGATVMAVSNRTGALALTTGNKSEIAVGYCTLYGDMVGGLAVIGDLPKTRVYRVAHEFNRRFHGCWGNPEVRGGGLIPESTLVKAPSAELRPDQTDQDSLPPYELLDAILECWVEEHLSIGQIVARGFREEDVRRIVSLVQRAEFKRRQAAPVLIVTGKAFSVGRRIPVAQRFSGEGTSK